MTVVDAVVIGAGPNGLAAANLLTDAGWDVLVLEANEQPGGAVRTAEVTAPGFRNDLFSAFYPMTAASPVFADLELHRHGLRWTHAPAVLAHPRPTALPRCSVVTST
jgi:phytoene dehydrogenase-like protein